MTFVGKVLVVVNVVLTVCVAAFAGGVYAFQTNWREEYKKTKDEMVRKLKGRDETIAEMKDERVEVDKQLAKFRNDAANYRAQNEQNLAKLQGVEASLKRVTVERDQSRESNKLLSEENDINLKLVQQYRKFLADLHKNLDTLTTRIAKLEDEKYGLIVERAQIDRRHNALLELVAKYRRVLAENKVDYDINAVAAGDAPVIPSDGIVLETYQSGRDRTTLVRLSVGKDDNIRKGQVLIVYRLEGKGKYLGKIEIVSITADGAVGQVIAKAKNGKIRKGDHVSYKL
ncbi:MAG: hypothetical protein Tsb009_13250 [Planctomycetaceae bacterium]